MHRYFHVHEAKLLNIGRTLPGVSWSNVVNARPCWEFIYYLRGCGRVDVPHASLHPRTCHLAVYPPPHASPAGDRETLAMEETIFFGVDVPAEAPDGMPLLLPDAHGEMRWLCERMLTEVRSYGVTSLAMAYLHAFLFHVERAWTGLAATHDDPIALVRQHIHANYHRKIELAELADLARLSRSHLIHRFSMVMNVSPMAYLRLVRVEAACRLLATTDQSVTDISARVGFEDPLYFSRAFRQVMGMPPSSYRHKTTSALAPALMKV